MSSWRELSDIRKRLSNWKDPQCLKCGSISLDPWIEWSSYGDILVKCKNCESFLVAKVKTRPDPIAHSRAEIDLFDGVDVTTFHFNDGEVLLLKDIWFVRSQKSISSRQMQDLQIRILSSKAEFQRIAIALIYRVYAYFGNDYMEIQKLLMNLSDNIVNFDYLDVSTGGSVLKLNVGSSYRLMEEIWARFSVNISQDMLFNRLSPAQRENLLKIPKPMEMNGALSSII